MIDLDDEAAADIYKTKLKLRSLLRGCRRELEKAQADSKVHLRSIMAAYEQDGGQAAYETAQHILDKTKGGE